MPKPYTLDVTSVFLPTPTSDAAMDGSPPEIAIEPSPPDAAMASPPDPSSSTPDAAMEGQGATACSLAPGCLWPRRDLGEWLQRAGRWPCRAARRWPLRAGRWPCRGALIGMYSDLTNTKPSSCTIRAENASLIYHGLTFVDQCKLQSLGACGRETSNYCRDDMFTKPLQLSNLSPSS